MSAFKDALKDCELYDLSFTGKWFTWERWRLTTNNIPERLDRSVPNMVWWERFPEFSVQHLS